MNLYIKIRFASSGVYLVLCYMFVQSLMVPQVYNIRSCMVFIESYFEMCNSRKYPYYHPLPTEGGWGRGSKAKQVKEKYELIGIS